MSLTTRVLIALVAGIGVGLLVSTTDPSFARGVVAVVEPIGMLFVNAIRMTVIPLVMASLIVGIATSSNGAVVAKIGGRGLVIFLILLFASGIVGAVVSVPVLAHVTPDSTAAAGLRAHATPAGASAIQTPAEWLIALVPPNVVRVAADGAMLPLIVFALVFGLALVGVPDPSRRRIVLIFRGIAESMLVIVRWLLVVAPLGVFALTLPLVARRISSAMESSTRI